MMYGTIILKSVFFCFLSVVTPHVEATTNQITEKGYVEAPTDTDKDGKLDKIYIEVTRPTASARLPTIYTISPYSLGGNEVENHSVDVDVMPQDERTQNFSKKALSRTKGITSRNVKEVRLAALERGYASVSAHSLGTGHSEGCPTVGDEAETLAAKAVIDWLNGRAKGFTLEGQPLTASWANGSVGMTGVSYNGTLPNMVATTGVEGLKAIVPVAAISNWYDYYRANGLVVGPGGYIGEDIDSLGQFIVRKNACKKEMTELTKAMGRDNGDFTDFWQQRDYVTKANNVRAAVFIIHGQSDWNVRQRHAIQWWHALDNIVPRRMWLHRRGHSLADRLDTQDEIWAWFDRYVKGINNDVEQKPLIEIESFDETWTSQNQWPQESTSERTLYLNANHDLSESATHEGKGVFIDTGKTQRLETFVNNPTNPHNARLAFVSEQLTSPRLMSGTPEVQLSLSVLNRKAANITVAIIDYDEAGRGSVVTRGWADPQNTHDIKRGELLVPGQEYNLSFQLEPKQYTFPKGHKIGVLITATDYDHTLRPNIGTKIDVTLGAKSFVKIGLSDL